MNQHLIKAIILLNLLYINILSSQKLNHAQGQLIVWFDNERALARTLQKLNSNKEFGDNIIKSAESINKAWNLHLFRFDHAKHNEDSLLHELKSMSEVKLVQKNHLLSLRKTPNDTYFNKQWHHLNDGKEGGISGADMRTSLAWDLTTGGLTEEGDTIVVCVIDAGIELTHGDLKSNFWINKAEIPDNQIDDDNNGYIDDHLGWNADSANDSFTENAHGTSVAGIVGAIGNNRVGVAGVNWNVKMMMIQGGGTDVSAIKSYLYAYTQRKIYNESKGKKGAYVVATNSSWGLDKGRPEDSPIWCAMYDSLGSVGILNVGSTSNLDLNVDEAGDLPTNCESDFLVGVTNLNWFDRKETRAGYGIKSIDLGAYGESVFTTTTPNTFRTFGGTSAAAPQVAGAIGLLYSLPCSNLPRLSKTFPDQAALLVKSILMQQTRKLNSLRNLVQTSGVMNIHDAMLAIHPLDVIVEDKQVIFQSYNSIPTQSILYFRKQGTTEWKEYKIENNQKIIISPLEKCTIYEYQISGICNRYQTSPSKINLITTEGCCTEPKQIQIIENGIDNVVLQFKDISNNSNFYYFVQEEGSTKVDTFEILNFNEPLFTLNGLRRCSRYNLRIAMLCSGVLSPISKPLTIETTGCDQCDDVDYCQRDRPSGDLEWIEAINVDKKSFISGNNNGFGDFVGRDLSLMLTKNETHVIEIIPGYASDSSLLYFAVWIDFNHNSILENSENIFPVEFQSDSISKVTFSIPSNARLGFTRMRVIAKYGENGVAAPSPCFLGVEFGEYEDYCIEIVDQICPKLIQVKENSKTVNSISLEVTKNNINDIVSYIYRKLPYGLWKEGSIFGSTINLTKLDSCSDYEIRLTNTCNNSISDVLSYKFNTIVPSCFIGTNTASLPSVKIYPNPFNNYVQIESDLMIKRINIYNLEGRLIHNSYVNSNSTKLNLELTQGLYFIEIMNKNGDKIVKKLVKE